jgi:hypothetical protein
LPERMGTGGDLIMKSYIQNEVEGVDKMSQGTGVGGVK